MHRARINEGYPAHARRTLDQCKTSVSSYTREVKWNHRRGKNDNVKSDKSGVFYSDGLIYYSVLPHNHFQIQGKSEFYCEKTVLLDFFVELLAASWFLSSVWSERQMHFWIDKRSQTCGFNGRHRVPSSLGGGRRWGCTKPMVTPVHRFQAGECVVGQYQSRRYRSGGCMRSGSPPYPSSTSTQADLAARAHAVELDSSVFLDLPLDSSTEETHVVLPEMEPVGKLKCGLWTCFALATVLIVSAKFYFNNQETALEVLVFAALMIVFLLTGCTISLCRSKATRDLLSAAVTASAAYGPAHPPAVPSLQAIHTVQSEEIPTVTIPLTEPPPPPYHIAILLPHQLNAEEAPPPSYDKAVS